MEIFYDLRGNSDKSNIALPIVIKCIQMQRVDTVQSNWNFQFEQEGVEEIFGPQILFFLFSLYVDNWSVKVMMQNCLQLYNQKCT